MPVTLKASKDAMLRRRTVLFPVREAAGADRKPFTSSTKTPRPGTSERPQWLVQVVGPVRRRSRVVEFPATRQQVTLGSGETCNCRINHPNITRMHAALVRRPHRGVYLVDLSEGGGTYVNGEEVVDRVLLMDRDRIRLGPSVEFEFLDRLHPDESRVRRWVRKMVASKTGWVR
jgi:pSer/pThr/pTyr-binding forkhead associated (FHA) protein